MRKLWTALMLLSVLLLSGCGYNQFQEQDEAVTAAWSEVLNQYQRRADLIPNLVNTVKGYAQHEQQVLTEITEARARVGSIQATPELQIHRAVALLLRGSPVADNVAIEYREAFLLHEVEGLKLREISELTGESINTIAARVRRTRERLQEVLETAGGGHP